MGGSGDDSPILIENQEETPSDPAQVPVFDVCLVLE